MNQQIKKQNFKINNLFSIKEVWSQDSCWTQQHLMFFELADHTTINKENKVCLLFTQDLKTEFLLMSVLTEHSDNTVCSYWMFINWKILIKSF